ncbi:MAG: hypothetical protein EXR36_06010 [Betaproteobacteria bacterium]|nr:hypothetical protein [Betaproteobacteria bacterium]
MNGKLISLAIGAALLSANAVAGDFKYRGFDDRHDRDDRREQHYERHDGGHGDRYSGRRHWAPSEHPRHDYWKHHRHQHDRWCNHWVPPHHAFGPSHFDDGSSITFILRGDLD